MFKIAVASDEKMVSQHFGHCKEFFIFNIEDEKIVDEQVLPSPGHDSGSLPEFLSQLGVNLVISGGMGQGATDRLTEKNIRIITGATGEPKVAVQNYIDGKLSSKGVTCDHGGHHDENHEHHKY